VPVEPPAGSQWSVALQPEREAGQFIDVTLLVGNCKISAHKVAIVSHSPYIKNLLTSGLAASKEGGDTLKIVDDNIDGRAVETIVECFYSGLLSLSYSTMSNVIRTANLLAVDTVEKAACDFFVKSLEPSTACEALAFAAAHSECGEHARGLHKQCVEYAVKHFDECIVDSSFLELPCEAVAELIESDDLAVEEAAVLAAVRAWFDHDMPGRAGSLKALVPLVRWPLLPVETRLRLWDESPLQRMMRLDDEAQALGMKLLTECLSAEFAKSDAAAACPRLKWRKGTVAPVLPLACTLFDQDYYATSEDGALLTATNHPGDRAVLCGERVMNSGRSCAEVTVQHNAGTEGVLIGVGRPTLDVRTRHVDQRDDFWGVGSEEGKICHNKLYQDWEGMQGYDTGDVLRLLLDSDAGTLTVKKNGTLLGVAVTSGLTGNLCWALACHSEESSVRIKSLDPADFYL
jgi:hypothetical protein